MGTQLRSVYVCSTVNVNHTLSCTRPKKIAVKGVAFARRRGLGKVLSRFKLSTLNNEY